MLPIYTRFLTPADYGVVGLLTVALAVIEPLLGARLGWAIPKFYTEAPDDRSRRTVMWGALGLTGAASAVSVAVLILFRGVGAEVLFGDRKYALALGLFSVTLLSQPIEQAGMAYLRLRARSGLFLLFSMTKLLLQLALNLLLVVYWREGVLGVVLSGVSSSVALGAGLTAYVALHEAPAFDWQMTRRMVQFCWPLWLSGFAGLYIGSSGTIYLRTFDTLSDVGLLALAARFAAMVGVLIWSPFFQHWEPMSYRYYKEEGGRRKFQVAFIAMAALLFTGGLGMSIFSEPVIKVMATKSYYAAVPLVPIITIAVIVNCLRQFFNFSFFVTGHTKIHSLCQYGAAAIITAAYVLLIPRFGLVGAAVGLALTYTVNFAYVRILSRRYYDPGFNLAPIGLFALISVLSYLGANVLLRAPNLEFDLLIKSFVMLVATALIGFVGVRSMQAVEGTSLETLPWPLHMLGRLQLGRQSGS